MRTIELSEKFTSGKRTFCQKEQKMKIYSTNTIEMISKYLNSLYKLKYDIKTSRHPDSFLAYYDNADCKRCTDKKTICTSSSLFLSQDDAQQRLKTFHNGIFNQIINSFRKLPFEILVGGSSGIAAIMKKTESFQGFEPKDMDIYVKNISNDKIIDIDGSIRQVFRNDKIIVVRRPLTLTWWIYDNFNNYITEIQLNMLHIRSWADVFSQYHSDMVSIGYDIKMNKFIVLAQRWNNFINAYPHSWFVNFKNDQTDILTNTAKKYAGRGFKCTMIKITRGENIPQDCVDDVSGTDDDVETLESKKIYKRLVSAYSKCTDIIISTSVEKLYDKDMKFPSYMAMEELTSSDAFVKYVTDHELDNGPECPVMMEKYNLGVSNKNCRHEVSLKAFVLMKSFSNCPICREKFSPVLHDITLGKDVPNKKAHHKHNLIFNGIYNTSVKIQEQCEYMSFDVERIHGKKNCNCQACSKNDMDEYSENPCQPLLPSSSPSPSPDDCYDSKNLPLKCDFDSDDNEVDEIISSDILLDRDLDPIYEEDLPKFSDDEHNEIDESSSDIHDAAWLD